MYVLQLYLSELLFKWLCASIVLIFFFTFIEIKKMSVFKNYEPGEPTCRLYVKNVAKQVEEKVSVCSTHKNKQTK